MNLTSAGYMKTSQPYDQERHAHQIKEQYRQHYGNKIDDDDFDPDDAWGDVKRAKQNISDYNQHLQ